MEKTFGINSNKNGLKFKKYIENANWDVTLYKYEENKDFLKLTTFKEQDDKTKLTEYIESNDKEFRLKNYSKVNGVEKYYEYSEPSKLT